MPILLLGRAIGGRGWSSGGVKLIPGFDPCDHSICKLGEVRVDLSELLLYLFGELNVALLDCGAILWEGSRLEEGDQLFLPKDPFVLLFQVDKWVAGLAVPNVG